VFKNGLGIQFRGDLAKNALYLTMASKALEELGMPADTWYKLDFNELMSSEDLFNDDEAASLGIIGGADGPTSVFLSGAMPTTNMAGMADSPVALMKAIVEAVGLESVSDYAKIKEAVEYAAGLLDDKSFVKDGDNYVLVVTPEGDIPEESYKFVITLIVENNKVAGYAVDLTAKVDGEDPASMVMQMAVDSGNKLTGRMEMSMSSMADMKLDITGQYKKGSTAPATEPPASASVLTLEELLGSLMGAPNAARGVKG